VFFPGDVGLVGVPDDGAVFVCRRVTQRFRPALRSNSVVRRPFTTAPA